MCGIGSEEEWEEEDEDQVVGLGMRGWGGRRLERGVRKGKRGRGRGEWM